MGRWSGAAVGARRPVQLLLASDGTVSGSDGCNAFGGRRWVRDGARVRLVGRQVTSLVACPGVEPWLGEAVALRVDDGRLVALDRAGAQLGTLRRVAP